MGELWRSQEMQLVQLYIQMDAAHDTVDELGKLGLIEFRDLNPHVNAFQRNFINEVKRADEMERKLRFFSTEIEEYNKKIGKQKNQKIVLSEVKDDIMMKSHMDELEARFDEKEKQILEMNTHQEALHRNYNQLIELYHVLEKDEDFFSQAGQREDDEKVDIEESTKGLGFISGVIARDKFAIFERILFRSTRGNLFMRYKEITEDIEDPVDFGKMVKKNVFIIFYHGSALQNKIKKICESFSANLYPCPETSQERKSLREQVTTRLNDLKMLLEKGSTQKSQTLGMIAVSLNSWIHKVKQEKGIYHTMNKFNYDLGRKCLIAEGWVPKESTEDVIRCLRVGKERAGALVPSIMNPINAKDEEPPTYFRTNKYTRAFQSLVDSYGIARYREINPAVLTIITFPYEFGIMFGDVGHGFLLLIFAMILIYKERDWEGTKVHEMIDMFYSGRYLIFLMALFSIYQGALYNEFFSQPMNFGSNYVLESGPKFNNNTLRRKDMNVVYAFGVDPVWKGATNELLYYNSVKMKMSIIVGIIQMTVGIFLHLLNSIHFKNYLDIVFEFIPRILFLWAIFGYLSFMIFYKWSVDYVGQDIANANNITGCLHSNCTEKGTQGAPVLLNELIFMFLPTTQRDALYKGQYEVQYVLLVLALLCVPTMLLPKPIILLYRHKMAQKHVVVHHTDDDVSEPILSEDHEKSKSGHGQGEFVFSEIMVHQTLETIEFVLGSVSHTASYLRLWALSLAHSELATVFWDKIMIQMLSLALSEEGSSIFVTALLAFAAISVWFAVTLVVMMFMEGLSAFLHALRLHWVEFQSKFYKGDGYQFLPFSYARILSGTDEEVD